MDERRKKPWLYFKERENLPPKAEKPETRKSFSIAFFLLILFAPLFIHRHYLGCEIKRSKYIIGVLLYFLVYIPIVVAFMVLFFEENDYLFFFATMLPIYTILIVELRNLPRLTRTANAKNGFE